MLNSGYDRRLLSEGTVKVVCGRMWIEFIRVSVVHVRDKTFVACNGDILYALNMTCNAVFRFCRNILFDEHTVTHSCKNKIAVCSIFRCFIAVMGVTVTLCEVEFLWINSASTTGTNKLTNV